MKAILFLFLILTSLLSSATGYDKNFLKSFEESVELNKSRFKDINLVYPGDTVLVVKREIVPVIIKPENQMVRGHDCVWLAVMRVFNSKPASQVNLLENKASDDSIKSFFELIKENLGIVAVFLIFMIFLLLLALLIAAAFRRPVIVNNNFNCSSRNFRQTPGTENQPNTNNENH